MGNSWNKSVSNDQPESRTPCQVLHQLVSRGVSRGNQSTGPSCIPETGASSSQPVVILSVDQRRVESHNEEVEREIDNSRVHWSELSSNADSDDDSRESNREIFERLRRMPEYGAWLNCHDILPSSDDIIIERKLAEGGQAEIFAVENNYGSPFTYVLKVFKKGYSLQDLQHQWPKGIFDVIKEFSRSIVCGGMVLKDDRFAFLLRRCDLDLRKLIDIAQEDNSPLWKNLNSRPGMNLFDEKKVRTPWEEFKISHEEPQTRQSRRSKKIFSTKCALQILGLIVMEMNNLHYHGVLHRDLKASNILCMGYEKSYMFGKKNLRDGRHIRLTVADYESSVGVVGTAFWRAPEILQQLKERKSPVLFTEAADVYSFAMICYEVFTGCIPFEEYETHDFDHVLRGVRPALPNHVPARIRDLIHKCWCHDPSERPSFLYLRGVFFDLDVFDDEWVSLTQFSREDDLLFNLPTNFEIMGRPRLNWDRRPQL